MDGTERRGVGVSASRNPRAVEFKRISEKPTQKNCREETMEEPLFLRDILELPARSEKPRKVGRTICGISLGRGRESIEQVARYVDQVKLYVHNTLMPARVIE